MRPALLRVARLGLAALPLLLFSNCPRSGLLCVKATETRAAALTVVVGDGAACAGPVKLTSIEVYRTSDYGSRWAVTARTPTPVSTVVYGVVPEGFEQSLPPTALPPGSQVTVGVNGPGVSGGLDVMVK